MFGEALGADESVVEVGFTSDGELWSDVPAVALAGVIDESVLGENSDLSQVAFAAGELMVTSTVMSIAETVTFIVGFSMLYFSLYR